MHRAIEKEKNQIAQIVLNFFLILCTCIMFFSLYKIWIWNSENNSNKQSIEIAQNYAKEVDNISNNSKTNKLEIDFENLKNINNDTVAWIKVNNTEINYPVVKTDNNDYYLNHSFNKKENSAGTIFMDSRNNLLNDKNIIFYGHNRKDGTMFGMLSDTLNSNWYKDEQNKIISVYYPNMESMDYEIFSIYHIENEEYYINTEFNSEENFKEFLKTIKERSIYDFEEDLDSVKQIITLSTCGTTSKTRVVVHAKIVEY